MDRESKVAQFPPRWYRRTGLDACRRRSLASSLFDSAEERVGGPSSINLSSYSSPIYKTGMHRQMLLLEAVLSILELHEHKQQQQQQQQQEQEQEQHKHNNKRCTSPSPLVVVPDPDPSLFMDPEEDDVDLSSELHQLDEIFARLVIKSNAKRSSAAAAVVAVAAATSASSSASSSSSKIKVPFEWEAEPGKPKLQIATTYKQQKQQQEQLVCPPPPRLYARSASTGSNRSSCSRRASFSGVLRSFIHGKLPSSDSFKFPASFSPSSSTKSSRIHHHDEPCDDEQISELKDDSQMRSPKAVFDGPGSCSSECTTSNVTPCNNLPFPASFMLPCHIRSFSSLSLSNAVPESPLSDAVSPLSFDTRGPCDIAQPGRYSYDDELADILENYDISPGWSNRWVNKQTVRSKSSGNAMVARAFSRETLFPCKSLSKFYKLSNNNNNNKIRSSTSSSEFSIELNGRLSSGRKLTSSRYLELDFKEAWNANLRAGDIYNNSSNDNSISTKHISSIINEKTSSSGPRYDVKSDIRSRVEEVVRNTDESKFTFSPVASSFLFSKSQSHNKSMQVFAQNVDSESYIEIQPGDADGGTASGKEAGKNRRRSWFSRFSCCLRS